MKECRAPELYGRRASGAGLKDRYNNLGEYLKAFNIPSVCFRAKLLSSGAYELAIDNQVEGGTLHRGSIRPNFMFIDTSPR